ncbi:MAG: hypothetical protein KDI31_17325 [Pseudomonadales bacterium]|nr:hypothetical protein [Pseudomonadales bacterium]
MNAQVTASPIEEQIQQIERIPVFGPYLSFMVAAQLSFADALGLLRLGTALRTRQAPFDDPAQTASAAPASEAQAVDALREAA